MGITMFLNALSIEDKHKFLSILYITAKIDGKLKDCEIAHISAYAAEMGIANTDNSTETLEQIISHFKSRPESTRKIVTAELLALAHIDNEFHCAEKILINAAEEEFLLPQEFKVDVIDWITTIQPLYAKGFKLVGLA